MSKFSRKIKRWMRDYARMVLIIVIVVGILAVGIWYGAVTNEKAVQEDFGDAMVSDVAQNEALGSFQEAIDLLAAGKEQEGRQVMQRLAPMRNEGKDVRGSGEAHLWMAKDILKVQMVPFLASFPLDHAGGVVLKPAVAGLVPELMERAERHLQAAVALKPEMDEAMIMLAELMIVSGKRNEAVKMLEGMISRSADRRSGLAIYLANAMVYEGDDVALKEATWLTLSTLGKEVTDRKVGDLEARMRYLLTIFILKREELAEVAIQKFSRDFADHENAEEMIAGVRASWEYFKAVDELGEKSVSPEAVALSLLKAFAAQPGRKELVDALREMVQKYPELKAMIQEALKSVPVTGAANDAARWNLLMAEVSEGEAEGYLKAAMKAAPSDPMVLLANLRRKMTDEEEGRLVEAMGPIFEGKGIIAREEFALRVARGKYHAKKQQWLVALKDLERALILRQAVDAEEVAALHLLMAEAYRALGRSEIAEQHVALAR